MNLDKPNKWLSLAANVGVIAGIAFLAIEVRSNTAAIHSASIQELTSGTRQALLALAADPALAELRTTGDMDASVHKESRYSNTRSFQYFALYRQYWIGMQSVFIQYRIGALPERTWNSYARIICQDMKMSGMRAAFSDNNAHILDTEFVTLIETCPTD